MKSRAESGLLGYVFLLLFVIPLAFLWIGYVISTMWGWFVAPTFGLPTLSIPLALGIYLTLRTFLPTPDEKQDRLLTQFQLLFKHLVALAFALGVGALVRMWI